jgi:DNA polymerase III delta subunit
MELMTGVRTKALVSERHLYIIMDDKEYLTNEKMWEKFTGLKDDVVVFYYTTSDKRLKFWKQNKDRAVEFAKLDTRILTKYIQKEAPLSNESCEKLIELCENDYGRILLEIDKIRAYSIAEAVNPDWALDKLIEQGVIYRAPKDAIFDFVAAFLERRPSKAYDLLQQSKAVGEANMVLLSVLYNNIKQLLQVQSAKDYKALGFNGFVLKNILPYRNNYSNGELVKAMKLIRECEKGIKIGQIPDELSVEYVMVQVM